VRALASTRRTEEYDSLFAHVSLTDGDPKGTVPRESAKPTELAYHPSTTRRGKVNAT